MLPLQYGEIRCKSEVVLHLRQHHLAPPRADQVMKMRRDGSLTQLNTTQTLKLEMHFSE